MSTAQSNDSGESQANPIEPTALNSPQAAQNKDWSIPSLSSRAISIQLSHYPGGHDDSQVDMVYFALEDAKQFLLDECDSIDRSPEDIATNLIRARRLQDIQNDLFLSMTNQVEELSEANYELKKQLSEGRGRVALATQQLEVATADLNYVKSLEKEIEFLRTLVMDKVDAKQKSEEGQANV